MVLRGRSARMSRCFGCLNLARLAARAIQSQYQPATGTLWFLGHWGFQYYMEQGGAKAVDVLHTTLQPGDVLVIPENNDLSRIPLEGFQLVQRLEFVPSQWLGIMSRAVGAGFYSSGFGPLPFAIGSLPPERYFVLSFRP